MNWQFWTGTGVFAGTTTTLLYVRWRATRSVRPSRLARRVLVTLVDRVGAPQTAHDVRRAIDVVPSRRLVSALRELLALELIERATADYGLEPSSDPRYHPTARGVVEAQRGVRGQHGRHR